MSVHSRYRAGLWHPYEKPMYGVLLNPHHPLSRGLVGCWLFNEGGGNTVFDLSGYGNHGTLGSGTAEYCPTWTIGKLGSVLSFDGDNDFIVYTNCQNAAAGTLEAWVSIDVVSKTGFLVDDGGGYLILGIYGGELFFQAYDTRSDRVYGGIPSTEILYHVVGTYKTGERRKIYVDGILKQTSLYDFTELGSTSNALKSGKWSDTYFNGTIYLCRLWKRRLSSEEVLQLYTDPFCMFYHPLEEELLKITGIAPLNIEIPLNCKSSSKLISKNPISIVCKLKDTYQKKYYCKIPFNLIFDSKFSDVFQLSLLQSLLVPLYLYPVYYSPPKEGLIGVLKPSIYADNYYYAYPAWLLSELDIRLTLSYIDSFRLVHDSSILEIYRLEDIYFKNFISNIPFHLLFDDRFTHEFQLLDFQSLLYPSWLSTVVPLDVKLSVDTHENFTLSYENSLIDSLLFSTSKYYVVGSVVIPLALGSQYISLTTILSANSSLDLKSNYKNFISSRFDIPLIINPLITEILEQQNVLSFTIDNAFVPVIKTTFDSYIIQSLDSQVFSSSVRDLNIPINLFLNYISSILSIINFSDTLNASSKLALENMIETIVPAILKDTYSSEYVGKATLDVSTDAEFVPLIQMIYEYSLIAPLLFSPILTTVKKAEALIKYLTIDIKKFNISIDIETIEQDG